MGNEQLKSRIVLITGAHGGLGGFVTSEFLAAGAHVAALAKKIHPGDATRHNYLTLSADLSGMESTQAAVKAVIDHWGKIDVLVHLVGGFAGGRTIPDTDNAVLEEMLDLNFHSAFNIARCVVPHMRQAGYGRIIAVGSRTAVEPQALLGAYGASKAALISLVRTLALENKDCGITANVVLPGTMDTPANRAAMPQIDPSDWVPPAQVAKLILWLASDEASQVSGAQIPIYGRGI